MYRFLWGRVLVGLVSTTLVGGFCYATPFDISIARVDNIAPGSTVALDVTLLRGDQPHDAVGIELMGVSPFGQIRGRQGSLASISGVSLVDSLYDGGLSLLNPPAYVVASFIPMTGPGTVMRLMVDVPADAHAGERFLFRIRDSDNTGVFYEGAAQELGRFWSGSITVAGSPDTRLPYDPTPLEAATDPTYAAINGASGTAVPEPMSCGLLMTALAIMVVIPRRKS